jgi:hypothetical protein
MKLFVNIVTLSLPHSRNINFLIYQPVRDGDDDIKTEDGTRYTRTPTSEWTKVKLEDADEGGRTIDPIEWSGEEVEVVNITDEELASLRDVKGEI